MEADQRWEANRMFLDDAIQRGDEIILPTPLGRVKEGSFFEKELQCLAARGYRPTKDLRRLIREEKS